MKRDMDLIRDILLRVEAMPAEQTLLYTIEVAGYSEAQIVGHIKLLEEGKYLEAFITEMGDGSFSLHSIRRLTMSGHDFIDSIRSDTVWSKVKSKVTAGGGAFTIDILLALAKFYIKEQFGLEM